MRYSLHSRAGQLVLGFMLLASASLATAAGTALVGGRLIDGFGHRPGQLAPPAGHLRGGDRAFLGRRQLDVDLAQVGSRHRAREIEAPLPEDFSGILAE